MSIKAWLDGDEVDLRCLADLFPYKGNGNFWINRQGDGRFYMSAPELDQPPAGDTHLKVITALVARANGIARAMYPDFKPVSTPGSFSEDGKPNFAQREFTIEVRPKFSSGLTAAGPPPSRGLAYADLTCKDHDLAEAIDIMGGLDGELDFEQLYKIYEIINDAGVLKAARMSARISEAAIRLFKQTAQPFRHARMKGKLSRNPMPIQKARKMIGQLLAAWLGIAQKELKDNN
jgi:flagellin-specific chaperone FliS